MTFWNLKNDAEAPEDGVLDIDGEIVAERGWFTPDGACIAKDFRKALKGVKNVTVHINSPGGDVMAGAEIYSALREHSMNGEGTVTVIVTALAASAASIIAMAGDRILMHPVAYMMIHNPWTIAMGDAKELRKTAKTLDVISEGLVSAYETRTGKDREELKKMLENETWMSAGTCVEEGFADGIYGAEAGAAASLVRPTMMSAKAHGVQEIISRIRAAEPEEDPEKEEEAKKRAEIVKRAEIARRASIAASAGI
jgi:ATP-dependent Clp protease protease subunit